MRLLLLKQDEITVLEEKLDQIDHADGRGLNLGCARLDNNNERLQTVKRLESSLAEYDEMLQRGHRTLSLPQSSPREVQTLKDWTAGSCCISRHETDYLEQVQDLANLTGPPDIAISYVESLLEDCIHGVDGLVEKHLPSFSHALRKKTGYHHVLVLGPYLQRLGRVLAIVSSTLIILSPTLFLPTVVSSVGRALGSIASAAVFLLVISFFTRARTVDVFASGASYTAVLVALTMGNTAPEVCRSS